MRSRIFIAVGLVFWISGLFAQNCDIILTGKVIDDHDDEPLIGAIVSIGETTQVTNSDGVFSFQELCSGKYQVSISHINCEPKTEQLTLSKSETFTFYLEHHEDVLEEIVVEGQKKAGEESKSATVITQEEIQSKQGKTFGDLLTNTNGVSLLKTGATITKPVINGLHSQRLLMINNGVKMEGQQWGLEHAPEIDPYTVQKISIIRGAGSVEYGADGIGGVIVVDSAPLPDAYGINTELSLALHSNGRGGNASANVLGKKSILGLPISFQAQGSVRKAGNLKAPNYFLDNTSLQEYNFLLRGGYVGDNYGFSGKLSQFNTELGILTDSHIGNESDLRRIIENGRPQVDRGFSYDILRPRQEIKHEIAQVDGYYNTKIGQLQAKFSRQYNSRAEFDRRDDRPGLKLKTETYTEDLSLKHQLLSKSNGKIGIQAQQQAYKADGFYLIPEYNQKSYGIYLFENYTVSDRLFLEIGGRYDYKEYKSFIPVRYLRYINTDEINYESIKNDIGVTKDTYNDLITFSAGATYDVLPNYTTSFYIGAGARQPFPNELYSDGVHHGTALWELGNPSLTPERSLTLQLNNTFEKDDFNASINLYQNKINDYIFLAPDKNLRTVFTIRGTFPQHSSQQTNAILRGIDYDFSQANLNGFTLSTKGAFLWADDQKNNEPLIYMQPNRLMHQINYGVKENIELKLGINNTFEQKRVPTSYRDYTAPPKGYTLFNLGAEYQTKLFNNKFLTSLDINNLLNKEYKDYLDRFRYFAHSPGRNFTLKFNYSF